MYVVLASPSLASVGCLGVWVGLLSFRVVLLIIIEGLVLPATIASVTLEVGVYGTGDELLLGEGDKISSLNKVPALESACG